MEDLDEFYKEYGQSLADRIAICNDTDKPGLSAAFVFVEEIEDPSAVLAFLNSTILEDHQPVFIWEQFEEVLDTGGRDNYHSRLQGTMAILVKAPGRDDIAQAKATGRKLITEALSLMLADAGYNEEGEPGSLLSQTIQLEVRQLPLSPIGPIAQNWYGRGLFFTWLVPMDLSA